MHAIRVFRWAMLGAMVLGVGWAGVAQEHAGPRDGVPEAGIPLQLAPQLRALLREEMQAVAGNMTHIMEALPLGDWDAVARAAHLVQESYILQQRLTAETREALHRSLPSGFKHLDERLHTHAAYLHRAAARRDGELAVFYVAKMMEGCLECHAQYATEQFPTLVPAMSHGHNH